MIAHLVGSQGESVADSVQVQRMMEIVRKDVALTKSSQTRSEGLSLVKLALKD